MCFTILQMDKGNTKQLLCVVESFMWMMQSLCGFKENVQKNCRQLLYITLEEKIRKHKLQVTNWEVDLIVASARRKETKTYLGITACFWISCHVISSQSVVIFEKSLDSTSDSVSLLQFSLRAPRITYAHLFSLPDESDGIQFSCPHLPHLV